MHWLVSWQASRRRIVGSSFVQGRQLAPTHASRTGCPFGFWAPCIYLVGPIIVMYGPISADASSRAQAGLVVYRELPVSAAALCYLNLHDAAKWPKACQQALTFHGHERNRPAFLVIQALAETWRHSACLLRHWLVAVNWSGRSGDAGHCARRGRHPGARARCSLLGTLHRPSSDLTATLHLPPLRPGVCGCHLL
jgi:hypothetical protein